MIISFFIRQVGRRIDEVKVSNCTEMSIGELNENDCKGSCNKGIVRFHMMAYLESYNFLMHYKITYCYLLHYMKKVCHMIAG